MMIITSILIMVIIITYPASCSVRVGRTVMVQADTIVLMVVVSSYISLLATVPVRWCLTAAVLMATTAGNKRSVFFFV